MATAGSDIECRSNFSSGEGHGDVDRFILFGKLYVCHYIRLISLIPSIKTDFKKSRNNVNLYFILIFFCTGSLAPKFFHSV